MKAGRRASLHFALPALIITLLVVLIGAGSFLAYHEVRAASLQSGQERLERVSTELAEVMERSVANTLARQLEVAALPDVQAAVRGMEVASRDMLARNLGELSPRVSTLPIELWDSTGSVVLGVGAYPNHWSSEEISVARNRIADVDGSTFGPVFLVDEIPYAWVAVPVLDENGRPVGHLVRVAAFANINAAEIFALIGSAAEIFLTNVSGGPWVTLDGRVVAASPASPLDSMVTYSRENGIYRARGGAIGTQPMAIVAEAPLSASLARPAAFLKDLMTGAVVLLLIGALAAWFLSRRITRPLMELSSAADDVAAGDYSRRVHASGENELGDLARAFSHMAAEVESTHSALNAQYQEARDLAHRLEATNERIIDAILEAEKARSEAEIASRAKSDFLATMSHEIRTPINAIVGYADLLQMEMSGPLNEEQRAHLNRLDMSSRHLLQLVNEVLDLASVESGNLKLGNGEAGALATLHSACSIVAPDFAVKEILLKCPEAGDPEAFFRGDPERVKQVLINLLSNAAKFTPSRGQVNVSVEVTEGRVRFVVADTGPGIPADLQEAIFEPFVQGDSGLTRIHGGAGLGLAISRKLAHLMGGDLTVSSELGRGARFVLRMPEAALARAEAESA